MNIFYSGSFYPSDDVLTAGTIGNLGFSKTECISQSLIAGAQLNLKCASGSIATLVDWGVVTHYEDAMQCERKSSNVCNSYLKNKEFKEYFDANCAKNTTCSLRNLAASFVSADTSGEAHRCREATSRLFVQYMCK